MAFPGSLIGQLPLRVCRQPPWMAAPSLRAIKSGSAALIAGEPRAARKMANPSTQAVIRAALASASVPLMRFDRGLTKSACKTAERIGPAIADSKPRGARGTRRSHPTLDFASICLQGAYSGVPDQ